MRFGIDARPLQTDHRFRGIGQYTRQLIEAAVPMAPDDTFVLVTFGNVPAPPIELDGASNWEFRSAPEGPPSRSREAFGRSVRRSLGFESSDLDVYLQTAVEFGAPDDCRSYCTVFDLIPLRYRRAYFPLRPPRSPLKFGGYARKVVDYATYRTQLRTYSSFDGLIAISETTRHEIGHLLRSKTPVDVVPLAAATAIASSVDSPSDRITKPFVLYVGADDHRKNVVALLNAFERIRHRTDCQLVLVGDAWSKGRLASEAKEDIIMLGYVEPPALAWLYERASAFVFPSLWEGFGLPVLEAMQYGCPVIAYATSAVPEVAGDAAMLLAPGNPLDDAMLWLLDHPAERAVWADRGIRRAAEFTWGRTATRTLQILRGGPDDRRRPPKRHGPWRSRIPQQPTL